MKDAAQKRLPECSINHPEEKLNALLVDFNMHLIYIREHIQVIL